MCIRDSPLTVLDGFERIVGELPQAKLYLVHFRRSDLLPQVQRRIADRPALSTAVHLLRDIPHPVSYTHLRAHETVLDLVCRLLLEKKTFTALAITLPQHAYNHVV